jgi:hypothetical protein
MYPRDPVGIVWEFLLLYKYRLTLLRVTWMYRSPIIQSTFAAISPRISTKSDLSPHRRTPKLRVRPGNRVFAPPPHIYFIYWEGLVRASGFRSWSRRPAMWALLGYNICSVAYVVCKLYCGMPLCDSSFHPLSILLRWEVLWLTGNKSENVESDADIHVFLVFIVKMNIYSKTEFQAS